MTEATKLTEQELHKRLAVELFNGTWDLLDRPNRSPDDNREMLARAHTSRWHWGKVGTPLEFERGDWLISRVYAVLSQPQLALDYARTCLEICEANGYTDFDIAFAHEAVARALVLAGDKTGAARHRELATRAGEAIADKGNRDYFKSVLETLPG